jgi:hypothetical protein
MTWYAFGEKLPDGIISGSAEEEILAGVRAQFSNLEPTSYEASRAYLDSELRKPKGQRNLQREMCMIMVMGVPENQKVAFWSEAVGLLIHVSPGMDPWYTLHRAMLTHLRLQ